MIDKNIFTSVKLKLFFAFIATLAFSANGQSVKIGDIAISDSLAIKIFIEYFLDCYNHPDTLEMEGGSYNIKEIDGYKKESINWKLIIHETWHGKDGLPDDERKRYRFLIARKPSLADFMSWFLKRFAANKPIKK